jgi:hypothetical protein
MYDCSSTDYMSSINSRSEKVKGLPKSESYGGLTSSDRSPKTDWYDRGE